MLVVFYVLSLAGSALGHYLVEFHKHRLTDPESGVCAYLCIFAQSSLAFSGAGAVMPTREKLYRAHTKKTLGAIDVTLSSISQYNPEGTSRLYSTVARDRTNFNGS